MKPTHTHKSYLAFLGHRISGVALAVFLPFHFLLLGTALGSSSTPGDNALAGAASLDRALAFADNPMFKFAEWGLVVFLSIHLLFGLRILALEFTDWPSMHDNRTGWILPALVAALFVGVVFLLQV